jgi:broad specificity phosphatase PhoE
MPVRLILVRHGKAAAGWDTDMDPGLDDLGHAQAAAVARDLVGKGPLDLVVSPLRRTRETVAPLEAAWGREARVEPRVAEIPSDEPDLAARGLWLRSIMIKEWSDLSPDLQRWRQGVIDALVSLPRDTVVVSHFIAINVAVGAAIGDPRVVHFQPDNCSATFLDVVDGRLVLVERGQEAQTRVL